MLESGDHIIYRLAMAVREGRGGGKRERGAREDSSQCASLMFRIEVIQAE